MGIRDIYVKPSDDRRPSRLWERLHPRQAEAYWADEQEKFDLEGERIWAEEEAERQADARYREWANDEYHRGNPPECEAHDWQIARYSEQYTEVSALEREQIEFEAEEAERGGSWTYPQHWTFTQWALERDYAPELIEEIDREFPPDKAEPEYAARWDLAQAEEERHTHVAHEGPPFSWEPKAPGLLRIIPMDKAPREREVRGETNPYDNWPRSSQCWAAGIEPGS